MSKAISNQLDYTERRVAAVKVRLRLLSNPDFQAMVEIYRGHVEMARGALLNDKLDDYNQGYFKGMFELGEDFILTGEELEMKLGELTKKVRVLQGEAQNVDNRSFRVPPPARPQGVAPVGGASHLTSRRIR